MKTFILISAFLLTTSVASAQHDKHQHGHDGGHEQREHEPRHEQKHGDREHHRHFDRGYHRRVGHDEIRFRNGRREIFFGGIWFGCDVWPEWVFVDEIYIEQDGELYYVHSYARPELVFQVNVVI